MKKNIIIFFAALSAFSLSAENEIITLDLTKAKTELTFDAETGAWDGTYDDDAESIESQCFSFVHNSMGDYNTWWGFTASNSCDNSRKDNTLKFQFSNMAKGGIVLNSDGSIKFDEFNAPETSAEVPYLVAFGMSGFGKRPVDMTFDGKNYEAVGVYVNLNSYPYYSIECGDSFARAFNNGDKYTLTIHGIAPDESEKTVAVDLASYTNGCLTISRGWMYVDLSSLGVVNELYFTLDSTDSGVYGMNTPAYFCLDKLMVKSVDSAGINDLTANSCTISYDRSSKIVNLDGADFAIVYDTVGNKVMTADSSQFSIASLPAGIYLVKANNSCIKIAK